jgi:hypothetical protein
MNVPTNLKELTLLFKKYGARQPESWARSQLNEGIPQLQRFLFLRQAWKDVIREGDTEWIRLYVQSAQRDDVGNALAKCLEKGVPAEDLASLVRAVQVLSLFGVCHLLDDPIFDEEELQDFSWGLFEVDEDGNPTSTRINGLHESVFETDPAQTQA